MSASNKRGGKIDSMDAIMGTKIDSMNSIMQSMEMEDPFEEEMSSLVNETAGYDETFRAPNVRKVSLRAKVGDSLSSMKKKVSSSTRVLPRPGTFLAKSICSLALLGVAMVYFMMEVGNVVKDTNVAPQFHQSNFGGLNNINQPAGAKAAADGYFDNQEFFIPVSNVGHAVPSVTAPNLQNLWGHYMHDEHRSPFASHLYDKTEEELNEIQKKYEDKMAKVRAEWGAWNFNDPKPNLKRESANFDSTNYRDVFYKDMPETAWQKDEEYVKSFIKEGKALVNRVLEGVYAEYGHPTKKPDGTMLTEEEKKARHKLFQVQIADVRPRPDEGIAWMNTAGWDGLIRKLLHAMITNDIFYFVLGGHSAAAGHGNNFYQTQAIMFHHLMEPIFNRLGVRLISRNMAMGGMGTLHTSLGGAYLYGEADFMWWDSSMTEKGDAANVFNRQALLSGERVPVIINDHMNDVVTATNNTVMWGTLYRDFTKLIPETLDEKQASSLPWASQYLSCPKNRQLCEAHVHKFDADCWIPRKDVPPPPVKQITMPGRASWHPGFRTHKFNGRLISIIFLHALQAAFEIWEAGIEEDTFPLQETYWHVGDMYKELQNSVRISNNPSLCASILAKAYLPERICRIAMRGATEWSPRRNGEASSLSNYIKPAPNGYVPVKDQIDQDYYKGLDVAASTFDIPAEHVDAHAIAIASHYPPEELDHSWITGVENDDKSNKTEGQRWLREQSIKVFNKVSRTKVSSKDETRKSDASSQTFSGHSEVSTISHRELGDDDDEVIPGQGWQYLEEIPGYCDGSSNSNCDRKKDKNCMLYAHNDNRARLVGDALSGWIVFNLPNIKEGVIAGRFEWWGVRLLPWTEDWTEVNNGKTRDEFPKVGNSTTEENNVRSLKTQIPEFPKDFQFDIAINGKIVKTWNREEFMKYSAEIMHNLALYPIYIDDEMAKKERAKGDKGETIELGLRIRSKSDPRMAAVVITHLYWA